MKTRPPDGSPPVATYQSSRQIRARLTVLYDKSWRTASYNSTLDPQTLDAKQIKIMKEFGCKLGRDRMPRVVKDSLTRTIITLENRLIEIEDRRAA